MVFRDESAVGADLSALRWMVCVRINKLIYIIAPTVDSSALQRCVKKWCDLHPWSPDVKLDILQYVRPERKDTSQVEALDKNKSMTYH
jgi:hypothetical protein